MPALDDAGSAPPGDPGDEAAVEAFQRATTSTCTRSNTACFVSLR